MSTTAEVVPYVIRGDAPAARFCGFRSTDKFIRWATERCLRPAVRRQGARTVYRVAELRAALDAEATTGRPRPSSRHN